MLALEKAVSRSPNLPDDPPAHSKSVEQRWLTSCTVAEVFDFRHIREVFIEAGHAVRRELFKGFAAAWNLQSAEHGQNFGHIVLADEVIHKIVSKCRSSVL